MSLPYQHTTLLSYFSHNMLYILLLAFGFTIFSCKPVLLGAESNQLVNNKVIIVVSLALVFAELIFPSLHHWNSNQIQSPWAFFQTQSLWADYNSESPWAYHNSESPWADHNTESLWTDYNTESSCADFIIRNLRSACYIKNVSLSYNTQDMCVYYYKPYIDIIYETASFDRCKTFFKFDIPILVNNLLFNTHRFNILCSIWYILYQSTIAEIMAVIKLKLSQFITLKHDFQIKQVIFMSNLIRFIYSAELIIATCRVLYAFKLVVYFLSEFLLKKKPLTSFVTNSIKNYPLQMIGGGLTKFQLQ